MEQALQGLSQVWAASLAQHLQCHTQHHTFADFHRISTFANLEAFHGNQACQCTLLGGVIPAYSFVCWQHHDQV